MDLIGANPQFVPDTLARQQLLETTPAPARLRLLISLLTAELAGGEEAD